MNDMFKNFRPSNIPDNRFEYLPEEEIDEIVIGGTCKHVFRLPFATEENLASVSIIYRQSISLEIEVPVDLSDTNLVHFTRHGCIIEVILDKSITSQFVDFRKETNCQAKVTLINGEVHYTDKYKLNVIGKSESPVKPEVKYKVNKIDDKNNQFLFKVNYDYIDYDYADRYFKLDNSPIDGKCSSCRTGNFYGRNLDWSYSNDADFVIRVPRIDDRYASIGMGFKTGFDYKKAETKYYDDVYKILPFFTVDGINECGVFCNTNVVPKADNETPTTKTGVEGKPEVSMKMVCRYVLDHYRNADEAVAGLANDIRIVAFPEYGEFEAHWMIGDADKTYVVEIVNNVVRVTETNIMTNFYVTDVKRNSDGSLFSIRNNVEGEECKAITVNKLGLYADGIERYNILNAGLKSVNSIESMFNLMERVNYTKAYTDFDNVEAAWYSENVGPKIYIDEETWIQVTNEWLKTDFDPFRDLIKQKYEYRSREDGGTWQTVHQCVYDLENKTLNLHSQQNDEHTYTFRLEEK